MNYPVNYQDSKEQLYKRIDHWHQKGYTVLHEKELIIEDLYIDKVIVQKSPDNLKSLVFSLGLHGIEGYVGHVCLMHFIDTMYDDFDDFDLVIYHPINPFGMRYYRRTNEENVDLNRNFSQTDFNTEDHGYQAIQTFFQPKRHIHPLTANISFYMGLLKNIIIHGIPSLRSATLFGQHIDPHGLSFSGTKYQSSTSYMMNQIPEILSTYQDVIWIDLHTGYGPRYQMSIVNSKYEIDTTKAMRDVMTYPRILGLNQEDFYEVDGDMIEMIYHIKQQHNPSCKLYAACFEFGTKGEKTTKQIASLKAMYMENHNFHTQQSKTFKQYADTLIKEQFMPDSTKWKAKVILDFQVAVNEILAFYNYKRRSN